jgi:predicted RNase H-like HicB family nuclease
VKLVFNYGIMYDIRIFLEEDGKFWARVNAWKEIVYWVWKNQHDLMKNIREWLEISFQDKKKTQMYHSYSLILTLILRKNYATKV